MEQSLPTSTEAERQRFLSDQHGDTNAAIAKLKHYLEWRKQYSNNIELEEDELDDNLDSWAYATRLAMQFAANEGGGKSNNDAHTTSVKQLPCTLFMLEHGQSTSTKRRYLHHLPARIDTKLANASTYAMALAIFLDHALDRHTMETLTLVIDVRGGHGWANIKAVHLLKFIQSTVQYLVNLHPMRLERCIIYPVPKVANVLWTAVKPFLGKDTSTKVCLVSGAAGKSDGVPKKLSDHLDDELIRQFEEKRESLFVYK